MFEAYGWIIVRSSRKAYTGNVADLMLETLDEETDSADEKLWDELEAHLSQYGVESDATILQTLPNGLHVIPVGKSLIKWTFYRHLNNLSGLLQVMTSRNHYDLDFIELLEWIAKKGTGSYGIIYVWDDDVAENEFRVLRLLKGMVEEYQDTLLSPIVPVIQDEPF